MATFSEAAPSSSANAEAAFEGPPTAERSALMARVKGKNTAPEIMVRRIAHRLGLRFRIHRRDLPGTPDLVFPKYGLVVFVHGCFWHRHEGCPRCSTPKTRFAFWAEKFRRNVERDRRNTVALQKEGWNVLTIWECQTKDLGKVQDLLSGATMRKIRSAEFSSERSISANK